MAQRRPPPSAQTAAAAPTHSFSRHSIDRPLRRRPSAAPMSSRMSTCMACEHMRSTGPLRTAWAAHFRGTCRPHTCAYARHTHPTRTCHTPSHGTCCAHTQAVAATRRATMTQARRPRGTRAKHTPPQVEVAAVVAHKTVADRPPTAQAAARPLAPRLPLVPYASNSRRKASSGYRTMATRRHFHAPACASLQTAAHESETHRAWDSAHTCHCTAMANSWHNNQRRLVC